MQADVKNQLIRALRLGGFTQNRDFLKRGNRYCVLGLLCLLYHEQTGKGSWVGPFTGKNGIGDAYCYSIEGDGGPEFSIELPSPTILRWAGIDEAFAKKLYKLNDVERQTFAGIANYLEAC